MTDTNRYNVLTGDWYNIYLSDCAYCDLRKAEFSSRFLCSGLNNEAPLLVLCGLERCPFFSGERPDYIQKEREKEKSQ